MSKLKVGILGATGAVGQKYISLLQDHPWFEVCYLAASEKSAGKIYADAVNGKWCEPENIPDEIADLKVREIGSVPKAAEYCDFVFSALDTRTAAEYEEQYAAAEIPVVSNAAAHRWDPDVPVLIPEINPEHCDIIPVQQKNRGWDRGYIVAKSNCSLQSYLTPLYALHEQFGIRRVIVTTLQAVSGAGYPGHSSLEMIDNIIPYIPGEEEKTENEPLKILGTIGDGKIRKNEAVHISAHCNRVPVIDGHTASVSVEFESNPSQTDIVNSWNNFSASEQVSALPSAPGNPIIYHRDDNRPQPRKDRDAENGMAVSVGRLRECKVLHWRFTGLSHNMIKGAAGGGILNAELLRARGYL